MEAAVVVKECRICLGDELSEGDAWLSPCRCAGSIKWVHQGCHNQWLTLAMTPDGMRRCQTCRADYQNHGDHELMALALRRRVARQEYLALRRELAQLRLLARRGPLQPLNVEMNVDFYTLFTFLLSLLLSLSLLVLVCLNMCLGFIFGGGIDEEEAWV